MQDATGAWWCGVFYLIATGIILISAWSSGSSFDNFSNHQLENAWSRGLETLHRMVDVHPSARDYAIALSGLKQTYLPTSLQSQYPCQGDRQYLERGIDGHHQRSLEWNDHQDASPQIVAGSNANYQETSNDQGSPSLWRWDTGLENIMLPAQLLQDMDEDLLLPNLF